MENNEKNKIDTKKILSIVGISICSLILFIFAMGIFFELVAPKTSFAIWAKENLWDITQFPSVWKEHQKTVIHCCILIAVIFSLGKLLRLIFKKVMTKSNRAKTVVTLLDGMIKYGAAIVIIFLILQAFGVNTAAIWESVGIITLIVGLGAQPLIADIIAGIFIIFEDEYSVGEIVSIDNFRGTVSEIGIRATKIIDMAGNIKIINNADIKNIVNLSRELSLAVIDCEFPYDVPLEFVEKLFKDNLEKFKDKIPAIVEGPYYKGVSAYGTSNVSVRLIAKCLEDDRYQVQRDLLREYRQLFVANGIDLSYEQVVINQPSKSEIKTTKNLKIEAEQFVKQQSSASSGLEDQDR